MPLRQILFFALLAMVGCAAAPPAPPLAVAASLRGPDLLLLRVSAPADLVTADLTTPEGRVIVPQRIIPVPPARPPGEAPRPSILLGGSAGSSSGVDAGVGLSLPMRNPFLRSRGQPVLSEVEFPLPAALLAAYRARPQDFQLYLAWGQDSRQIPAPALDPGR